MSDVQAMRSEVIAAWVARRPRVWRHRMQGEYIVFKRSDWDKFNPRRNPITVGDFTRKYEVKDVQVIRSQTMRCADDEHPPEDEEGVVCKCLKCNYPLTTSTVAARAGWCAYCYNSCRLVQPEGTST